VNFGYQDGKVYMHSAVEGKKLDIIRENPDVCLVFRPLGLLVYHQVQKRHGLGEGFDPGAA